MKRRWLIATVAVGLTASSGFWCAAQQPRPVPPLFRQNPLATRQHLRLAFLAGQWEERITYAGAQSQDAGFTGRWRARPLLGLYLQIEYEGQGPQGAYRAFAVLAWDREARLYRMWWMDDAAGIGEYQGNFTDENTLTLEHSGTVEGRAFRERIRYSRIAPGEVRTQVEQAWGEEAFQPYLEATARRVQGPGRSRGQPQRD